MRSCANLYNTFNLNTLGAAESAELVVRGAIPLPLRDAIAHPPLPALVYNLKQGLFLMKRCVRCTIFEKALVAGAELREQSMMACENTAPVVRGAQQLV